MNSTATLVGVVMCLVDQPNKTLAYLVKALTSNPIHDLFRNGRKVVSFFCPDGGMVDAVDSKPTGEIRKGSSPFLGTNVRYWRTFFVLNF